MTGDVFAYVDYYQGRQRLGEVIDALAVLLDHLATTSGYWGGDDGELHRRVMEIELAQTIREMMRLNQDDPAEQTVEVTA